MSLIPYMPDNRPLERTERRSFIRLLDDALHQRNFLVVDNLLKSWDTKSQSLENTNCILFSTRYARMNLSAWNIVRDQFIVEIKERKKEDDYKKSILILEKR